ncbi:hypothetical protein LY78DRAFT_653688 [Colletotrichum sublineola]|nr:hypothetical protein LY78DRAFT_653688 [Colletotrichum sublineola]
MPVASHTSSFSPALQTPLLLISAQSRHSISPPAVKWAAVSFRGEAAWSPASTPAPTDMTLPTRHLQLTLL